MKAKSREEQLVLLKNMKDVDINFSYDAEITNVEVKFIRPNHLFYKPIKNKTK